MASRIQRPRRRQMLSLTVRARERISPHRVRVTLGGDDVRHLEPSGYDRSGRLFFAGPGEEEAVVLPDSERWMLQLALAGSRPRPHVRTYTLRRVRPEAGELDLEVALHGAGGSGAPAGPGVWWALGAALGSRVAFLDEGFSYAPPPGAAWQLLVGDETALPALLAVLECSAPGLPAVVFAEVPAPEDIPGGVIAPPGSTVRWLPREDPVARPGALALRAVRAARFPGGRCYAWVAGEAGLATGVRRHLVGERGVARADVTFRGYFRHGRGAL
ncbi:siderophore-interacting protein [Streptomyces albidoflavus]